MAQDLTRAGLQICSGLASGIDSKAHEGALDSGRKTLAVMGTGIDRVYPSRNKTLAQRIVENGALVSEFPMGTPPYSSNFPRRNRIISGLAGGTLVVEASIKSGSLITARLAMEQNRDVFAMPGPVSSPQSRGCHQLIKQGAKLVEEPTDILEELGVIHQSVRTVNEDPCAGKREAKSEPESKFIALKAIDHQGCLFQAIQSECELSIPELNTELIKLEAAGLIRQEGGRYFRLG
jgi:DNA processing protein